jgi:DNA-binding LytR/AlgR family response regulator
MESKKILVVEDDALIAESLCDIIECLEYQLAGVADTADLALDKIEENLPDLILLDIQLKGVMNGIELARIIADEYKTPFIFTTAFADKETIAKARREGPYGYVVKPYGIKDIHAAIEMALNKHHEFDLLKKKNEEQISANKDGSLFLKVDSRLVNVYLSDIKYVECKGDYAVFKTETDSYIIHATMKTIQGKLGGSGFLKVHRSYIVNLSKIVDIEDSNILIGDKIIPISRANKEALLNKINTL